MKPIATVAVSGWPKTSRWYGTVVDCHTETKQTVSLCHKTLAEFVSFPTVAQWLHFSVFTKKPKNQDCFRVYPSRIFNEFAVNGEIIAFTYSTARYLHGLFIEHEAAPLYVLIEWS